MDRKEDTVRIKYKLGYICIWYLFLTDYTKEIYYVICKIIKE